ncbi:MAG: hypothetical protein ACM3NV_05285, partial [Syntrophothermus sp.]
GRAKRPAIPERWLRLARPALLAAALAVVLLIGWSGLFATSNRQLEAAVASEPTVARIRAEPVAAPHRPSATDPASRSRPGVEGPSGSAGGGAAGRRPPLSHPPRIIAFGDSVMVGAAANLKARLGPGFSMNAKVGRQAGEFVALVRQLRSEGRTPNALILQMGNNGPLYSEEMEAIQRATADVGELFLINDHAPVSWVDESNHALAEAAEDWPHTTLIDWAAVAAAHEDLLWDGIHLRPGGAGLYARLVDRAVREMVAFPPPSPRSGAEATSSGARSAARG